MTQTVRPKDGAAIKPGPMISVVPDREVTDEMLAEVGTGTGLNGPFLADQLSAWITHERMAVNLFTMLGHRTTNPVLQALFGQLKATAVQAVAVWEALITGLGGNPQYASPMGRMTEGMDSKIVESFLLNGSADPLTFESAGLQAAFAALSLDVLNTQALATFADKADDGDAKQAMDKAAKALATMAETGLTEVDKTISAAMLAQVKSGLVQKAMQGMEKAAGKIKDIVR